MRQIIVLALSALAACAGATAPKKVDTAVVTKPKLVDPAIRIHVLDRLDATTAMGRATWAVWELIYSTDPNQAGIGFQGSPNQKGELCAGFGTDFIGQRQAIILAIADTVHTTVSATATTIANAWYSGNRTLPAGWMAIASDSVDWGVSAQFDAGHGQTITDPIRWTLTWSGNGTAVRAESPNDLTCPS